MPRGIEIRDITVGTGDEATKESVAAVDVRMFLRRGDEVSQSPWFGTRMVIDVGRRDCIAGLRYGIPGMRVGGTREIMVSPHLAYGKAGVPGRIPPNALLRCEVKLVELREHRGLLAQDWVPGRILTVRRAENTDDPHSGWEFSLNEGGSSWLGRNQTIPDNPKGQLRWIWIPVPFEAEQSADLIQRAIDLPAQMPEDCVWWKRVLIDSEVRDTVIRNLREGTPRILVQIRKDGLDEINFGVQEDSPAFRDSPFYQTIERLIKPHLSAEPKST
jgi:hypothetical protein